MIHVSKEAIQWKYPTLIYFIFICNFFLKIDNSLIDHWFSRLTDPDTIFFGIDKEDYQEVNRMQVQRIMGLNETWM